MLISNIITPPSKYLQKHTHKIHHNQIEVRTEIQIQRLLVTISPLASMNSYKRICIILSIYSQ